MIAESWPQDLLDFAFIPAMDEQLRSLAGLAEKEDWAYHNTPSEHEFPILYNYLRYSYRRLAEEDRIALSTDEQFACFNTGLVTQNQEALFACFEVHRDPERQPWYFKDWLRKGQRELNRFHELPDMAHYFEDPSCLVFDTRKELRVNIEHMIESNKQRFPEPYASMDNYGLQTFLKGAIDNAKERVKRSYRTAIPQYYNGQVQLLLPLCLASASKADLAMVIEHHPTFHRATTCLTLDMAYNNARQITKPDRDWLQP
jgi:hypothetical protein